MDELFDDLAREAAAGMSRRRMFRRFLGGLTSAVLVSVGFSGPGADCARCCELLCRSNTAPGGVTPGECMRDCLAGGSQYVAACVPFCS